jgi:hypothetical protein
LIPQKFLSIEFLFLLEFAAYKKLIVISLCYCSNISVASKTKNREKREGKKKCSKRHLLVSTAEN